MNGGLPEAPIWGLQPTVYGMERTHSPPITRGYISYHFKFFPELTVSFSRHLSTPMRMQWRKPLHKLPLGLHVVTMSKRRIHRLCRRCIDFMISFSDCVMVLRLSMTCWRLFLLTPSIARRIACGTRNMHSRSVTQLSRDDHNSKEQECQHIVETRRNATCSKHMRCCFMVVIGIRVLLPSHIYRRRPANKMNFGVSAGPSKIHLDMNVWSICHWLVVTSARKWRALRGKEIGESCGVGLAPMEGPPTSSQ